MADINEKFKSVEELYRRLEPAFIFKIDELNRDGILNVNKKDIWDYCLKNKWDKKTDLRLYEMVSDIVNIDNYNLSIYIKKQDRRDDDER